MLDAWSSNTGRRRALFYKFCGDGEASAGAEGFGSDFEAGGGLAAFVFVGLHGVDDPVDGGGIESFGDDVVLGCVVVHVAFQDGVQDIVGREGILVGLAGLELCGGGFGQDTLGDDDAAASAVDESGQVVYECFRDIGQYSETAGHVTV